MRSAIGELSDGERDVVRLTHLEQLTHAEAAARLAANLAHLRRVRPKPVSRARR